MGICAGNPLSSNKTDVMVNTDGPKLTKEKPRTSSTPPNQEITSHQSKPSNTNDQPHSNKHRNNIL